MADTRGATGIYTGTKSGTTGGPHVGSSRDLLRMAEETRGGKSLTTGGKATRQTSVLSADASHAVLGVEFFEFVEMETHECGGYRYEDLLLRSGSTLMRINTDFVPPGFEAPHSVCPCQMKCPMAVMRGSDVKKQTSTTSNDEARLSGLLLDLEFRLKVVSRTEVGNPTARLQKTILLPMSGNRVLNPLRRIIYFAHSWAGSAMPDNSAGSKLRLIKSFLNEDDYAWLDVWSIPRPLSFTSANTAKAISGFGLQPAGLGESNKLDAAASKLDAAVRSVQSYIFHATLLLFVAPQRSDVDELLSRAWCQAELFAAMCPVVRRQSIKTVGPSWSCCTRVIRHACKADVLVGNARDQWHGGEDLTLIPLSAESLRNPLACKTSNQDGMTILKQVLEGVRQSLEAVNNSRDEKCEVAVVGLQDSVVDTMLKTLSL